MSSSSGNKTKLSTLTLAALGVVFGDIGTSPLYTIHEIFSAGKHPVGLNEANILGILSLTSDSEAHKLIILIYNLLFDGGRTPSTSAPRCGSRSRRPCSGPCPATQYHPLPTLTLSYPPSALPGPLQSMTPTPGPLPLLPPPLPTPAPRPPRTQLWPLPAEMLDVHAREDIPSLPSAGVSGSRAFRPGPALGRALRGLHPRGAGRVASMGTVLWARDATRQCRGNATTICFIVGRSRRESGSRDVGKSSQTDGQLE